jgi:hypothetical protein
VVEVSGYQVGGQDAQDVGRSAELMDCRHSRSRGVVSY